jgi:L-arabinokinase
VADYAGALVLEVPTRQATEVVLTPENDFVVGPCSLSEVELVSLARAPFEEVRKTLVDWPRWTHYVVGVAVVLLRYGVVAAPVGRVEICSDVPLSVGVASSAALEVATARALGADRLDPVLLASLCQEAENQVVGVPCGVMDQVAVAAGIPGEVLPILCRPAEVGTSVPIPDHLEVVGWPTGAAHDVGGIPYRTARVAAFMGKRMVEDAAERSWNYGSELPTALAVDLPDLVDGAAFIDRFGEHGDVVTSVDPSQHYPVRAATLFGVEEHVRSRSALSALEAGEGGPLGSLMAASHAGYNAIGLGHPAATEVVAEAVSRPGVYGARSSGGGCGGTVVVLCERGALDDVDVVIR